MKWTEKWTHDDNMLAMFHTFLSLNVSFALSYLPTPEEKGKEIKNNNNKKQYNMKVNGDREKERKKMKEKE